MYQYVVTIKKLSLNHHYFLAIDLTVYSFKWKKKTLYINL